MATNAKRPRLSSERTIGCVVGQFKQQFAKPNVLQEKKLQAQSGKGENFEAENFESSRTCWPAADLFDSFRNTNHLKQLHCL